MRREWDSNSATASNVAAISRQANPVRQDHAARLVQGEWFPIMALELWHQKVSAALGVFFIEGGDPVEVSDRTRRAWASGESELPAYRLALLLRSSEGPRILCWIMRNDPPEWWLALQGAIRELRKFA